MIRNPRIQGHHLSMNLKFNLRFNSATSSFSLVLLLLYSCTCCCFRSDKVQNDCLLAAPLGFPPLTKTIRCKTIALFSCELAPRILARTQRGKLGLAYGSRESFPRTCLWDRAVLTQLTQKYCLRCYLFELTPKRTTSYRICPMT